MMGLLCKLTRSPAAGAATTTVSHPVLQGSCRGRRMSLGLFRRKFGAGHAMGTFFQRLIACVATACISVDSSSSRLFAEAQVEVLPDPRTENSDGRSQSRRTSTLPLSTLSGVNRALQHAPDEANSIEPIAKSFMQDPDGFGKPGQGISLDALGEPKSGTTWLGRVVPALALELCGSFNNQWCQVGGMTIIPHPPASLHEFELLKRNIDGSGSPELFLHFKGIHKHVIPGMDLGVPVSCRNGGRLHRDYFLDLQPCASDEMPTRDQLVSCLYDTSPSCVRHMPSADPAVRRSIVIMRDPRNVVISEYMMRTQVIERERWTRKFSLDEFIMWKFEVLVSWIHQRYMWHTGTLMGPSSHITVYEELQKSHLGLIDIAGFMGLQCSEQQAAKVWIGRRHPSPNGGYASRGLSVETVSFMNATMARLLPPALALRWDVTPTEL